MNENYEYECALSGKTAEGELPFDGDNLGDLPPGWIQVTLTRRVINPEWLLLQQTKEAAVTMAANQIPANVTGAIRNAQVNVIRMHIRAQYHAIEAEIPPYLSYTEQVHIAPPESDSDLLEAFNELRESLGLEAYDTSVLDDGDEDNGSEDDDSDNSEIEQIEQSE